MDGEAFGKQMLEAVRAYVQRAVEPFERGLAEVRALIEKIPAGKDGTSVHPDTVAMMVNEAVSKAIAALPPVQHGRDALDISILPSIDEKKSYPAGTYACYAGGLILSTRSTDPIADDLTAAGWRVLVEGSAVPPVITQGDDPREITVATMLTSGTKVVSKFYIPMVIDQGVYKADATYRKGDGVTWGGSFSIAKKDDPQGEPSKSDDWRLAIRKGRDGKDYKAPADDPVVRLK